MLSDPDKRQIYDTYGEEGLKGGVPPPGAGGPQGFAGGFGAGGPSGGGGAYHMDDEAARRIFEGLFGGGLGGGFSFGGMGGGPGGGGGPRVRAFRSGGPAFTGRKRRRSEAQQGESGSGCRSRWCGHAWLDACGCAPVAVTGLWLLCFLPASFLYCTHSDAEIPPPIPPAAALCRRRPRRGRCRGRRRRIPQLPQQWRHGRHGGDVWRHGWHGGAG